MVGPRVRKRQTSFSAVLFVVWLLVFLWVQQLDVQSFWKGLFYLGLIVSAEALIANSLRIPNRPAWLKIVRRVVFIVTALIVWPTRSHFLSQLPQALLGFAMYVALVVLQIRLARRSS